MCNIGIPNKPDWHVHGDYKRRVSKMICEECGSDDFDIFVDEFGDKVAYCMVCGTEYLNVDDDE